MKHGMMNYIVCRENIMKNSNDEYRWKERCDDCKNVHIFHLGPCPDCGIYQTRQPVSENISCGIDTCEMCQAYEEHLYYL